MSKHSNDSSAIGAARGRRILFGVSAVVYLYLFAPIVWIVLFSFNKPVGKYNYEWKQFTLENWTHAFDGGELLSAFWRSLLVALVAVSIATVLGSLMALALSKYRFRGSAIVDIITVLPLTTPEIVLGASLLTMFTDAGVSLGFWTVVASHVLFCLSFVALTVKARIRGFDWRLEDAAADLGAGPWRTFTKVTFPLVLPGILAAALLSFALSIDDYIITSFNKGEMSTMPTFIWDSAKVSFRPQINVLATMILVVSVVLLVITSARSNERVATGK